MANTYRKIYIQIVFAVENRQALLIEPWREEVFKYIAGVVKKRDHYSLAVNGSKDHIHFFLDYNPNDLIADLVREVKKSSNSFINKNKFSEYNFGWQSGYGVFSHGYREKATIIEYIKNQKEHHRKISFKEEYLKFLKSYDIDFKNEYIFKFNT